MSVVLRFERNSHWASGRFSSEMLVMRRLRMTTARIFPATDRREMPRLLPQSVLLPLFLNRETNVAFLNSLGTSSSSQMLVRSEWSASRATGPADLKISVAIPSIPGDIPELVCLIALETSSIVGGRSRLVITGFCGIWSSTKGSTVEGLLSRVLKCSLHLALMLLFSLSRSEPSADRSGVVRG